MKMQEIVDDQILLEGDNFYVKGNELYIGFCDDDSLTKVSQGVRPFYSVIRVKENSIECEVDLVRSYPIFFCVKDDKLYLSNTTNNLINLLSKENLTISETARISFLHSGYTTGDSTLFKEIMQVTPGMKISFDRSGKQLSSEKRFSYEHNYEENNSGLDDLKDQLGNTLISVFKRMMENVGDRQVVLPLSGGKDSRLIALILKELSVKNILCFTYGDLDSKEAKISKQVAEQLGFDWEFIPYSVDNWNSLYKSPERDHLFNYCFNSNTLPHIQDWPAIKELKSRSKIEPDAYIVPGHSADLPAGSFSIKYPKVYEMAYDKKLAAKSLQSVLYSLNNPSEKEKSELVHMIELELNSNYCDLSDAFDSFFIQEKISKFIVNSMRTYEFYGFNWWLPFWDPEFWDFWRKVPKSVVLDQRLYKSYLSDLEKKNNLSVDDTKKETKRWYKPAKVKKKAKELANRIGLKNQYHGHSMKWYGIMDEKSFKTKYKGYKNINSFLAEMVLESINENK
jgi:asparagine synthase (glutamine-hydrolysing)